MNRRAMIAGLACVAVPWASPGGATQTVRGCFGAPRHVHCVTGFAQTPPMPVQTCRRHAWATCLAYLMRGFGATLETGDVLGRHGLGQGCAATSASDRGWLLASAGHWQDARGRDFLVSMTPLGRISDTWPQDPAFATLLDRLARQPVLCGAAGHTTVITQIGTMQGLGGWTKRTRVTVQDPYAGSHGLRDLSADELARDSYVLGLAIRAL